MHIDGRMSERIEPSYREGRINQRVNFVIIHLCHQIFSFQGLFHSKGGRSGRHTRGSQGRTAGGNSRGDYNHNHVPTKRKDRTHKHLGVAKGDGLVGRKGTYHSH